MRAVALRFLIPTFRGQLGQESRPQASKVEGRQSSAPWALQLSKPGSRLPPCVQRVKDKGNNPKQVWDRSPGSQPAVLPPSPKGHTHTETHSQEDDLPCPPGVCHPPHSPPIACPGGLSECLGSSFWRAKGRAGTFKGSFCRGGPQTGCEQAEELLLSACRFCFRRHSPRQLWRGDRGTLLGSAALS